MSNWLTLVIVLLIIVILVDGYRRRNKNRISVSPALKKSLRKSAPIDEIEKEASPNYLSELPNGGARVIGHRDASDEPPRERKLSARELKEQRRNDNSAGRTPEQASLNLNASVPILMESVEHHENGDRIEPHFSESESYNGNAQQENGLHAERNAEIYDDEAEDDEEKYDEDEYDDAEYDEDYDEDSESDYHDDEDAEDYDEELDEELTEDEPKAAALQTEPEEVLIINIMAQKGEVFHGSDLLDIVLKCGLRYGDMDIFHRYSDTKGSGALLFSMANMVKPGTYDLDAMDEFTTPGVTLFMTLPIDADSMQSFELMVETAQAISQTLHGELKDEQRSAMTKQTLEHSRQRISDFERKKLFRRPR